ncbi:MAG TPA: ATP-binding protein [Candidatus Binatia bacterium]|nr:ATP-binding protein [Candidatus Binatia bacterium]
MALGLVSFRRPVLLGALAVCALQGGPGMVPAMLAILARAACNEAARFLVRGGRDAILPVVANAQIALDTLLVAGIVAGAGHGAAAAFLLAPLFVAYGALVPIALVLVHAAVAAIEIVLFDSGIVSAIPAFWSVLVSSGAHATLAAFATVQLAVANAFAACLGYRVGVTLRRSEAESWTLVSERGELLARNEREAARVRALLDVAQHVSGSQTVDALLRAVCDTTAALTRAPRVEIFLWDADEGCLRLQAAHGLEATPRDDVRYPRELPVVARLRAGEVVQFGATPSHAFVAGRVAAPTRRGFAAPMICRGSFEGALFVGYESDNGDELTALVQGIARQAAVALENVRAIEQQQEDAEVSRVLLELSQRLSACLDEEELWTLVTRGAADVLGLSWAVATRFDEYERGFFVAATEGIDGGLARNVRLRREENALVNEALEANRVAVATGRGPAAFGAPRSASGRWIGIPLVRGGWVAGFLAVGGAQGGRGFTRRQLRLADGLAHHAAIALQNARLVADLEEADRLKSEFVSTMSHELRTPLNVIIGYTEMLREEAVGPVTSAQRDVIDRLDARGRELLDLIEATLHVGRLEAGRDMIELATMPLADLLRALHASTVGLPHAPAVEFDWHMPEDIAQPIVTDRAKVALVVRNLVSNAFKFTAQGTVQLRIALEDGALAIEVEDTGIGIGAEHLPLIFDMFRQVDGSSTRRHGGVGLGLYIVKQFVTRLGGTVTVKSTLGRGTCFRVVLPATSRDLVATAA